MPEMGFTVRWPDGVVDDCYSPSLVMHDHLLAGSSYSVEEFVARSAAGLHEAGRRVAERYGFACSSAAEQLAAILARATAFASSDRVEVLAMEPPLPRAEPAAAPNPAPAEPAVVAWEVV